MNKPEVSNISSINELNVGSIIKPKNHRSKTFRRVVRIQKDKIITTDINNNNTYMYNFSSISKYWIRLLEFDEIFNNVRFQNRY